MQKKPWTEEEDQIIVEKYKWFGPHWVKISIFLPGRNGNNIKNRWHKSLVRFHTKQERRSKKVKWETSLPQHAPDVNISTVESKDSISDFSPYEFVNTDEHSSLKTSVLFF